MLAYTNRYLALASLIRNLLNEYEANQEENLLLQISSLRGRISDIKNMQALGMWALIACTLCMFALFFGWITLGKILFAAALILMVVSLVLSTREIAKSAEALDLELNSIQHRTQ